MGVLAVLIVLVVGLVAWPTVRPGLTAPEPLPPRPPLVVVESLPRLTEQLGRWGASGQFTGGVLVARGDEVLFLTETGACKRGVMKDCGVNLFILYIVCNSIVFERIYLFFEVRAPTQ